MNVAVAHQDMAYLYQMGNVKLRITTGFDYEELQKSFIIGKLAEELCKRYRYREQVYIDLDHFYVGDCEPDYFLSFDSGVNIRYGTREKAPFKKDVLVVRMVSRQFDVAAVLKLLEYGIKNIGTIKSGQSIIKYVQNYNNNVFNTIDTLVLKAIATGMTSGVIDSVLGIKMYREVPKKEQKNITYYFQHNMYHLFSPALGEDKLLLTTGNVYQLKSFSAGEAIVFNTDSSFYYINTSDNNRPAERWLKYGALSYEPFRVEQADAGEVKISVQLSFRYYEGTNEKKHGERNMYYNKSTGQVLEH
jgi:hypothetical protein